MKPFLALLFFLLSQGLLCKTYEVNGQHSFVNFDLEYMKISEVKGTFDLFHGAFEWDGEKLSQVEFVIQVSSINTRDPKRDNHLKRKDFFYVSEYPSITFIGNEVIYKSKVPSRIKGLLTIRGIERPYSFDIDWKGEYSDPVDKKKKSLFLKVKAILDRQDFNIKWNKALDQGGWVVGEKVNIEVIIEANPTDARPAFSRFYTKKRKIIPGKLELSKDDDFKQVPLISPIQKKKRINNPTKVSHAVEISKIILGFVLFCLTCVVSIFFKKRLLEFLEKRMRSLYAEFISDMLLYSFLLVVAYLLAPLMGYGII
ncbi:MAG: YceI family protein [Bacteriovoracaceae bacterium]|nr:YceI family protein [Bacteriovoracaceae bacterium]